MTQPDDEFRARHAEIARLMNRHKDLLTLLRDDPLAAYLFVTVRAAQEEIFGEGNIPVGGSGGTTKGDTDMNTTNASNFAFTSGGGAGGGGATVTNARGGNSMAGSGGGVAGDVPSTRTAMDELETRIEFGEFTLPDWMLDAIEMAMELDATDGGRRHRDRVFSVIMSLMERTFPEFIEALTWGVR